MEKYAKISVLESKIQDLTERIGRYDMCLRALADEAEKIYKAEQNNQEDYDPYPYLKKELDKTDCLLARMTDE